MKNPEPSEFESKILESSKALLDKGPQLIQDPSEDEKMKDFITRYCNRKTSEVGPERYACLLCEKNFKGSHFVEKHITVKHEETIQAKIKSRFKEMVLENYLADPQKLVNQPEGHTHYRRNFNRGRGRGGYYQNQS
jgi:hypothetical protein